MTEHLKNPTARRENLLIEEVAGELLVYDTTNNRAHCLNKSAAAIWRHCDGSRSLEDLAEHLFPTMNAIDAHRVIGLGIERLRRRQLLENSSTPVVDLSKRDLLKKVAILATAAGVAAPLVTSVIAPSSAYAFSCDPTGSPCTPPGVNCCSGACLGGHCI